jgi:hypothetical protein
MVTLAAGNLLDRQLEISDATFNTPSPQGPLFARERTILLTGTVVW